jgi:hypothetical protein
MTREDKELLLKDLCVRLPYGVKIAIHGSGELTMRNVINSSIGWYVDAEGAPTDFSVDEVKPYLRPMSSLTEEETLEFVKTTIKTPDGYPMWATDSYDWLNAHHFDYRGLIVKRLAIEAPEDMYKTE